MSSLEQNTDLKQQVSDQLKLITAQQQQNADLQSEEGLMVNALEKRMKEALSKDEEIQRLKRELQNAE